MYTVLEANLLQLVDIVGGVLPLLVIEAVGYASNGGCSCGCGVSCTQEEGMPYARWHCPSDVGFSCSGDLGSDLLFGGNRQAPCSIQNVEVQWFLKLFFAGVPGICSLLAMFPCYWSPITSMVHRRILTQIDKRERDETFSCTDPLTGSKIALPQNTEEEWFRDHFSMWEQRKAAIASNVGNTLRCLVSGQLALTVLLMVALIMVMALAQNEEIVALGCLLIAGVFVLVGWHALRFRAVHVRGKDINAQCFLHAKEARIAAAAEGDGHTGDVEGAPKGSATGKACE